jgi:hypothetical protein
MKLAEVTEAPKVRIKSSADSISTPPVAGSGRLAVAMRLGTFTFKLLYKMLVAEAGVENASVTQVTKNTATIDLRFMVIPLGRDGTQL